MVRGGEWSMRKCVHPQSLFLASINGHENKKEGQITEKGRQKVTMLFCVLRLNIHLSRKVNPDVMQDIYSI